jgi:hypothetical protein
MRVRRIYLYNIMYYAHIMCPYYRLANIDMNRIFIWNIMTRHVRLDNNLSIMMTIIIIIIIIIIKIILAIIIVMINIIVIIINNNINNNHNNDNSNCNKIASRELLIGD